MDLVARFDWEQANGFRRIACGSGNCTSTDVVGGTADGPLSAGDHNRARICLRHIDLPPDGIEVAAEQARSERDEVAFAELVASIREHGILQSLLVRGLPANRHLLIAGHGRLAAAKLCGLAAVPCLVYDGALSDAELLRLQLHENQRREGLNPVDQGRLFLKVRKETGLKQQRFAEFLGVSQAHLSECMLLAKAPAALRDQVEHGTMSGKKALRLLRAQKDAVTAGSDDSLTAPAQAPESKSGRDQRKSVTTDVAYREFAWTREGLDIRVSGKRKSPPPLDSVIAIAEHWLDFLRNIRKQQSVG